MIKPRVSIILPIYNVEKYIQKTLSSVINQTLKDIEIICIEDCSTDMSPSILKKFADADDRIIVIQHECNKGVSIARRDGVLASSGEYIMFLDGDDYLNENACEELYNLIKKEKVDILQFGTTVIRNGNVTDEEVVAVEKFVESRNRKVVAKSKGDLVNACFVEGKYGFTLWNKIYLGDIVRKAITYYPEARFNLAEDLHLFFLMAFFSRSFLSTNKRYHYYNFGAGTTGGVILNQKNLDDRIAQGEILSYLKEFARELRADGIVGESIATIQSRFVSDIIYGLFHADSSVNKSEVLYNSLKMFPHEELLSGLLEIYYNGHYNMRKRIISLFKGIDKGNSANKKIKTIATFYYRIDNGGVERVISKLMPMWIELGYRVVLFTEELPSPNDYECPKEVTRVIIPKLSLRDRDNYKFRIKYWQDMLLKYDVDVMVYHAWIAEFLFLDLLAIKSMNVKFIVHTHGFFAFDYKAAYPLAVINNIMLNNIYEICDSIVTLSGMDYNWWIMRCKNVYKTINPISVDTAVIVPSKLNNSDIIWVGRISPEKQPMEALKILKIILDSGYSANLHFVGRADDETYYKLVISKIKRMGLQNNVIMHGFHKDVSDFFEHASIYLHTSEFEGFSLSILESKAYGLPAVIYDLPNIDMVREKRGMRVVEQGDAKAAAREIIYLLENKEARTHLGEEARKSFEEMQSFNMPQLWKSIFTNLETNTIPSAKTDEALINSAVEMMLDFTAQGIERRTRGFNNPGLMNRSIRKLMRIAIPLVGKGKTHERLTRWEREIDEMGLKLTVKRHILSRYSKRKS